jgi:hypothetical protein
MRHREGAEELVGAERDGGASQGDDHQTTGANLTNYRTTCDLISEWVESPPQLILAVTAHEQRVEINAVTTLPRLRSG